MNNPIFINVKICIVIPCYNEERRLRVEVFNSFISQYDIHFLFVDDGSLDNTKQVIQGIEKKYPEKVQTLILERNSGKAEAVRKGMLKATTNKYDFIGFFDSDLATPLNELEQMRLWLEDHDDFQMIMGIRIKRLGSKVDRKVSRHYLGRVFATFVSVILGLPTYDTQCGAKIISRDLVEAIIQKPFESKWFFDVELIMRIRKLKGASFALENIYEYPLFEWKEIGGSNIKLKHYFIAPFELIKIKLRS